MPDHHEEQVLGKAYDAQLMRRLLRYIRPYRGAAALAFLYIIAGSALSVLPPWLTKVAIDRYIRTADLAGLNGIAALYILTLLGTFAVQLWPDLGVEPHGPEDHVRPAHGDFPASVEAGCRLFRQESRRQAHDAGDHRRGCAE